MTIHYYWFEISLPNSFRINYGFEFAIVQYGLVQLIAYEYDNDHDVMKVPLSRIFRLAITFFKCKALGQ